eukprot:2026537-Rhodomonas_salina.1
MSQPQRSTRGVKSWFGSAVASAGVRAKPKPTSGYKRAAAQPPSLRSPAKSQRGAGGPKRHGPSDPPRDAGPPASWGGLRVASSLSAVGCALP